MKKYDKEIEAAMQRFFKFLTEKEKRHYAALEAKKLGHGGQSYIACVLGISERTIQRGLDELLSKDLAPVNRVRREGGGRKPFDKKRVFE